MDPNLESGQIVGDRYVVGKRLEKSRNGTTYSARDRVRKGERVRLRVFVDEDSSDPAQSIRHEQELARAVPPIAGIVVAREVGADGTLVWRATEWRDGHDLRVLAAKEGAVPVATAVDIGLKLARIVAQLHRLGIAHLGLDLQTIHVGQGGDGIWIDGERFWRALDGSQDSPYRRDTSRAPEYATPDSVPDARTDVFDMSCLLTRLIMGMTENVADSDLERCDPDATVRSEPLPHRLLQLLERSRSADLSQRPKDADAFLEELSLIHDEFSIAATRTIQAIRLDGGDDNATVLTSGVTRTSGPGSSGSTGSLSQSDFGGDQPFEIESVLGRGGMGVVYLARDKKLDRKVAIKLHEITQIDAENGEDSLVREARMMARLPVHPNVVAVFAADELVDGRLYVVMEYIEGGSLHGELRRDPKMTFDRFQRIARDICAGVAHAHSHGLVHKDIKPANVMVAADGRHKIADFGIAHALQKTGMMGDGGGTVSGTPAYMSPEQFENQKLKPTSDVYAIGCLLYELASGAPPFTGRDVWRQHFFDQPRPLRFRFESPVNDEIERIIMKALSKDPNERYEDAGALGAALARTFAKASSGETASAIAPKAGHTTAEMAPRSRGLRVINYGIIVLAVALAGVLVFKSLNGTPDAVGGTIHVMVGDTELADRRDVQLNSLSELRIRLEPGEILHEALWTAGATTLTLATRTDDDGVITLCDPLGSFTEGVVSLRFGADGEAVKEDRLKVTAKPWTPPDSLVESAEALLAADLSSSPPAELETRQRKLETLNEEVQTLLAARLHKEHPLEDRLKSALETTRSLLAERSTSPVLRIDGPGFSGQPEDEWGLVTLDDVTIRVEAPREGLQVSAELNDEPLSVKASGGAFRISKPSKPVDSGTLVLTATDRWGNRTRLELHIRALPFTPPKTLLRSRDAIFDCLRRGDLEEAESGLLALEAAWKKATDGVLNPSAIDTTPLEEVRRAVTAARDRKERMKFPPRIQASVAGRPVAQDEQVEVDCLADIALAIEAPNDLARWTATYEGEVVGEGESPNTVKLREPAAPARVGELVVKATDKLGIETALRLTVIGRPFQLPEAAATRLEKIRGDIESGDLDAASEALEALDLELHVALKTRLNRDSTPLAALKSLRTELEAKRQSSRRVPRILCAGPQGPLENGSVVTVRGLEDLEIRLDCQGNPLEFQVTWNGEPLEAQRDGAWLRLGNPPQPAARGTLTVMLKDARHRSVSASWSVIGKPFSLSTLTRQELSAVVPLLAQRRDLRRVVTTLERLQRTEGDLRAKFLNRQPSDLAAITDRLRDARKLLAEAKATPTPQPITPRPVIPRPQLKGPSATHAGLRFIRVNVSGRPLYVCDRELPWGAFASWWAANGSRFNSRGVTPKAARIPVTGIKAEAFQAFARSIGARIPTRREWETFADAKSGSKRYLQAYPDVRSPNCNSRVFNPRRLGRGRRKKLSLKLADDPKYGGHGLNGSFFHLAGNVSEIVKGPGGRWQLMGSSYKSKTTPPLGARVYEGPKPDVGVRLVIDG